MNEQEIIEKIKTILKPYARNTEALDSLQGDVNLVQDLQINSSRLVDIVLNIEDTFDIEVDDEELGKISNLQSLIDLIKNQIK